MVTALRDVARAGAIRLRFTAIGVAVIAIFADITDAVRDTHWRTITAILSTGEA